MYLWIKALHIIFLTTWFAGLFYLPRLFVYHAECQDSISNERFKVMERKLYILMSIGGVLTAIFGFVLLFVYLSEAQLHSAWLTTKLLLVGLLVGYHFYCGKLVRIFREDKNTRNHVFYRWFNEAPSILLIGIVILVVVKPF